MPFLLIGWPLLGALLIWLMPERFRRWIPLSIAGLLTISACAIALTMSRVGVIHTPGEWIRLDTLGMWMIMAITATAWPILVYFTLSSSNSADEKSVSWLLAMLSSMYLVVITGNIGLMWVAVEATTLCSTLLVAQRGDRASLEAAWKYVLICSVGIVFALLGTIVLYFASIQAGSTGLDWTTLVLTAPALSRDLVRLAFVFALVGYGAKAGVAPMHNWLPDAYSQAPAPISGILSGIPFGCAAYALMRFFSLVTVAGEGAFAGRLLIGLGILSLAVAAPFMMVQGNLKRLLAYSSVEHMGIVVLGLGFGGALGVSAALLHLLNHALVKPAIFLVAGEITHAYSSRKIPRIRGLMTLAPKQGVLYLALVAALAGLPPFALFRSELLVFEAGMASGWVWPALAAGLLVLIFGGLLYHSSKMAFGPPAGHPPTFQRDRRTFWAVALPLAFLVILGVALPGRLHRVLEAATQVVIQGVIR